MPLFNRRTSDLLGRQTTRSQAANLMLYDMTGPGWRAEETAIEKLKVVTPAQIQEVARRYLKNISFTVLGDPSQIDDKFFTSRRDVKACGLR